MSVLSRAALLAEALVIRNETAIKGNTPTRVGGWMADMVDSSVLQGEALTPPTTGNGLTGTNVFSVLPDGATLSVSASGAKIADITGPAFLGRSLNSVGAVVPIVGGEGEAARVVGGVLGFGTLPTAAYADASVTLAKMANIATDSLIGRDAAGSGVPENITLNATLSMTGAGALQRAALAGAISASAGSNTTAFASGDFGALDVKSTGTVTIGALASTTGDLRVKNGFTMLARDSTNTSNVTIMQFPSGDQLVLGDNVHGTIVNGSNLSLRAGNVVCGTIDTSFWTIYSGGLQFLKSVTAPTFSQQNETANGLTGQKTTIHAQNSTGTTTVGGSIDFGPGSGTTTGGLGRLLSGSSAARYSWNDVGHSFFAAAVAAQVADMGALTDSTGGTANGTMIDVGAVFVQANINDNFADVGAKITAIRNCLRTAGLMA